MANKVLFVDDEKAVLESIRRFCHKKKFTPVFSTSPIEALELIKTDKFTVIVTDMRMPDMDGAEMLKKSLEFDKDPIKIVLTGYADMEAVQRAINEGNVYKYLSKPLEGKKLLAVVEESIAFYEEKQKQQQRLLRLGEFVSRIVHDLKNPLIGIKGSAETLLEFFKASNTAEEFCRMIIDQSEILTKMAQELLEYASRPEDQTYNKIKIVDVEEMLTNWVSVWESELEKRSIDFSIVSSRKFNIEIIPNYLHRALNNIIRNSLDMKELKHIKAAIDEAPNNFVSIKFIDDAGGIPAEIISKIFESFFTYGKSHGTGLGLANTKSIVEHFKGVVNVSNKSWEHGLGAQFEVLLPLHKA